MCKTRHCTESIQNPVLTNIRFTPLTRPACLSDMDMGSDNLLEGL
jgi:hypothetical protein